MNWINVSVIVGISIIAVSASVIFFEMPSLRFGMETGFISIDDANKIVQSHSHAPILGTTFVTLQYKNQIKENYYNSIIYVSDPYTKQPIKEGQKIIIFCNSCQDYNQTKFAWEIQISDSPPCGSERFVDAKTGDYIGVWYIPCNGY